MLKIKFGTLERSQLAMDWTLDTIGKVLHRVPNQTAVSAEVKLDHYQSPQASESDEFRVAVRVMSNQSPFLIQIAAADLTTALRDASSRLEDYLKHSALLETKPT